MNKKFVILIILFFISISLYAGGGGDSGGGEWVVRDVSREEAMAHVDKYGLAAYTSNMESDGYAVWQNSGTAKDYRVEYNNGRYTIVDYIKPEKQAFYLDTVFFKMLSLVLMMGRYFNGSVHWIAKICFALSLGIGAVKLMFGMEQLNELLTKVFLLIVTYTIVLFIFPNALQHAQRVVGTWAEISSTFANSIVTKGDMEGRTGQGINTGEFLEWVNSLAVFEDHQGIEDVLWKYSYHSTGGIHALITIDLNILNRDTNLISLDRCMLVILRGTKAIFTSNEDQNFFQAFMHFPLNFMILLVNLIYIFAFLMAIVEYCGAIIQFSFLKAVGVIFIPLMLWDQTKSYFDKLLGSLFVMMVRLLLVQIVLYMCVFMSLDTLKTVYYWNHDGKLGIGVQALLGLFCMSFLTIFIVKGIDKIVGFFAGGTPQLGIHEFEMAANTATASAALGAKTFASMAGAVQTAAAPMRTAGAVFKMEREAHKREAESAAGGGGSGSGPGKFGEDSKGKTRGAFESQGAGSFAGKDSNGVKWKRSADGVSLESEDGSRKSAIFTKEGAKENEKRKAEGKEELNADKAEDRKFFQHNNNLGYDKNGNMKVLKDVTPGSASRQAFFSTLGGGMKAKMKKSVFGEWVTDREGKRHFNPGSLDKARSYNLGKILNKGMWSTNENVEGKVYATDWDSTTGEWNGSKAFLKMKEEEKRKRLEEAEGKK